MGLVVGVEDGYRGWMDAEKLDIEERITLKDRILLLEDGFRIRRVRTALKYAWHVHISYLQIFCMFI